MYLMYIFQKKPITKISYLELDIIISRLVLALNFCYFQARVNSTIQCHVISFRYSVQYIATNIFNCYCRGQYRCNTDKDTACKYKCFCNKLLHHKIKQVFIQKQTLNLEDVDLIP